MKTKLLKKVRRWTKKRVRVSKLYSNRYCVENIDYSRGIVDTYNFSSEEASEMFYKISLRQLILHESRRRFKKQQHNPNEEYEHNVLTFWLIVFGIVLCILVGTFNKCHSQTRAEVLQEIVDQDIKHPKIVMAQFRLETANGTSKKCRVYKNLFGMKFPAKRETTALGKADDEGYAYFSDWKSAITDYKLWQDAYYKNEEEDYYVFLKRIGYATSTKYIKKLKEFNIKLPE